MVDKDEKTKPTSSAVAATRLNQVVNHISTDSTSSVEPPSTPSQPSQPQQQQRRRRRRAAEKNELLADYSDVLGQLDILRKKASTPDLSNKGYARQKQAGKLWVRERVTQLVDPGSFREIGSVSGTVTWETLDSDGGSGDSSSDEKSSREEATDFVPSNNVQGFGLLRGRKIVFTADDFSIRAGHADGALAEKTIYMEKLAIALRLPIVKLVDGSSGGGSVTTIKSMGHSYIPPMPTFKYVVEQLNLGIPNLGASLGPSIGLGAARLCACHFSVMAADVGSLFNAGPKVVAGATFEEGLSFKDLGGPGMHCTNGTVDNLAANEEDCFEQLRAVLSYLPNSGETAPPTISSTDPADRTCEILRSIIPRKKARMYNAKQIIETVVDKDSWFEIGALWGTTAIVGLARLSGRPVGIISLNCEVNAGAIDAAASQKMTRHLKFCDIFNLPLLQFVDVPGYAIGTVAERSATMRHGIALATTYYATTMPVFSVITRRVYGVAGGVMLDCRDPRMRVAWPSGEWGSLPLDGGIEVGHAAELKRAASEGSKTGGVEGGKQAAAKCYAELESEYTRLMNPIRTANAFGIEEIIDPAQTRRVVCAWAEHVYEVLMPLRLVERAAGRIRPVFY